MLPAISGLQHTYFNALEAQCLDELVVATDDQRIADAVKSFGGKAVLTSDKCQNGTERCLEVLNAFKLLGRHFDIVVNIQGDEPLIEAEHIEEVVRVVAKSSAVMGTLARPGKGEEDVTPVNNVKTVVDVNGYALYFSRALIPHNK